MSLSIITTEDLMGHRESEEEINVVILVGEEECTGCKAYEPLIEELSDRYPDIPFYRLIIDTADYPLFAPPVLPFVVGMSNGHRMWEGLGVLKDVTPLTIIIDEWIEGTTKLAPSGSTFTMVSD